MASSVSPTKFAPVDWHTSNLLISSTADRQRQVSHDIRQISHTTRKVTESNTDWTQHGTDSQLAYRIRDIHDWKKTLTTTLHNVETEITKLSEHKQLAEKALEAKNIPLEVVLECLSTREHRVSIDLVRDEVETELQKELEVIGGIQSALLLKINAAFQQLCVLQKCHEQLSADLEDKDTAAGIDSTCAELTNKVDTISMQADPTRIMKGIVTPHQWGSFSTYNAGTSETEIRNSERIRESINQTIRQTNSDLEAQWTATHYAFRKRKHEIEQVKAELEWQKRSTEKEIADMNNEIQDLQVALAEKTPPMMVAHTRLESRTYRPNVELCRDEPQYGMVEEIAKITEAMQALQDKLDVANETLGVLARTLERIEDDLKVKINSLDLDEQCMQVRQKLSEHPKLI